jgi:hypothetical protein
MLVAAGIKRRMFAPSLLQQGTFVGGLKSVLILKFLVKTLTKYF